ncbi:glycine--tRNA ligase subunit alpha [Buchnera aphidicola (Neophyllaphis podocarpi)]|uniref:glycine--tRNA ligase subunit alpha n=1 Tax=Buchnera aphidicola TaxID=9 RepID=UPI0031B7FC14
MKKKYKTVQNLIMSLQKYWEKQGCSIIQPIDIQVGAGTFHPATFFNTIGSNNTSLAYTQISRRPRDGRYGKNINRLQQYYQFQVIIKPPPKNIKDIYLKSLKKLNISTKKNDIRFIEDNWENPTLGACGIGWEIWINGMEVTQFTYFQQMGGLDCNPISVEITYGIERIAMHSQEINNIFDIIWDENQFKIVKYKDLFYKNEIEQSNYNFKIADTELISLLFKKYLKESIRIINIEKSLIIPAYENMLKACHYFNLLESRKAISTTERQKYILEIRYVTNKIAKTYIEKNNNIE